MAIWKNISQLNVYVDESGTVSLQDPNTWYISVAIIVPSQHVSSISSQLDQISATFFSGGAIKSSNVGNDNSRRKKVLEEVAKLDFQYLFLYVNKTKIDPNSGRRFKGSFYKNLNKKLYQKLCQCGGDTLSLVCKADQYGDENFQNSAKKYFENKMSESLFQSFKMEYADDKSNRILQLADFIAGTLAFCWVPEKKDNQCSQIFRNLLKNHEVAYETFPRCQREIHSLSENATREEINAEIENVLYNRTLQFIERHKDDDNEYSQQQIAMLNMLLEDYSFDGSRSQHFYLNEIQDRLAIAGFEKLPRQQFISRVIGSLRYNGIIISGSNKGYCLALSLDDIKDYLNHNATIIFPMLDRIKEARSVVKTAMNYDILTTVSWHNELDAILEIRKEKALTDTVVFDDETAVKINS